MKKILILLALLFFALPVFAEQIDINSATLSQLDELTGIGSTYAQRIIDGRPYSSVDNLDRVKGIGPATLQKIKDQGIACVNCVTSIQPAPTPTLTTPALAPAQTVEPPATAPAQVYASGIFINEILPNPEGSDETDEWVELYNSNNFNVNLSGWKIQDTAGTITTFIIPKHLPDGRQANIPAGGFLVFKRPETKIMLNNDEDGLNLLTPDNKVVDSVSFTKAPLGQSYSKASSGWAWSTTLTPATTNIITAVAIKNSKTILSNTKNSVNNNSIEAGLANLSLPAQAGQSPWFLFLTALAITIISAAAVLFVKLKFLKI